MGAGGEKKERKRGALRLPAKNGSSGTAAQILTSGQWRCRYNERVGRESRKIGEWSEREVSDVDWTLGDYRHASDSGSYSNTHTAARGETRCVRL
jgi:hypothetical protein